MNFIAVLFVGHLWSTIFMVNLQIFLQLSSANTIRLDPQINSLFMTWVWLHCVFTTHLLDLCKVVRLFLLKWHPIFFGSFCMKFKFWSSLWQVLTNRLESWELLLRLLNLLCFWEGLFLIFKILVLIHLKGVYNYGSSTH